MFVYKPFVACLLETARSLIRHASAVRRAMRVARRTAVLRRGRPQEARRRRVSARADYTRSATIGSLYAYADSTAVQCLVAAARKIAPESAQFQSPLLSRIAGQPCAEKAHAGALSVMQHRAAIAARIISWPRASFSAAPPTNVAQWRHRTHAANAGRARRTSRAAEMAATRGNGRHKRAAAQRARAAAQTALYQQRLLAHNVKTRAGVMFMRTARVRHRANVRNEVVYSRCGGRDAECALPPAASPNPRSSCRSERYAYEEHGRS